MKPISLEQAPEQEAPVLTRWLMRLVFQINDSIRTHNKYEPIATLPEKYEAGEVYYFSQAVTPDITGEGLWLRKSTSWVQLG